MFGWKGLDHSIVSRGDPLLTMIAAYMKFACCVVFVCFNYSASFKKDDVSSFKEFGQVGETARKWHTNSGTITQPTQAKSLYSFTSKSEQNTTTNH